jgi:hypothetical protein
MSKPRHFVGYMYKAKLFIVHPMPVRKTIPENDGVHFITFMVIPTESSKPNTKSC